MVLEMKVPSPGESITEVEIAQWLIADGDYVEKDQAIAEVDTNDGNTLSARCNHPLGAPENPLSPA